MVITRFLFAPYREYALIAALIAALGYHYLFAGSIILVLITAAAGSIIPFWKALVALRKRTITIEAFNFFALAISFVTEEYTSAAFIALMLTIAAWLDWKTEARATNAVEELLKLKPTTAIREKSGEEETIDAADIAAGDILIIKNGGRVPADGVVVYGEAFVNEASLTGESRSVEKHIGDEVFSSTVVDSGVIKMRATKVGKDSTLEKMARLINDAAKNKLKAERLADRFAGIFLPIVLLAGAGTYLITGNILMTAALFLVVCADDIAVSIPLAVTASLGHAAKRGVIIKGGKWLHALANVKTLVFDKTGTLTYGTFALSGASIEPGVDEKLFWSMIAIAEKFSEHPVGRALYKEGLKRHGSIVCDPDRVRVARGIGIWAKSDEHEIVIGNERLSEEFSLSIPERARDGLRKMELSAQTSMLVFLDGKFAGILSVADMPKQEAGDALRTLKRSGIRVVMLTGDNPEVARNVSQKLGIDEFYAQMTPESKLHTVERFAQNGGLAMVGDGINDAPALARADVGIAMGGGGTAVAVEAADVIILTDRIDRIDEMITLARRTISVINADMGIWLATNIVGIALVFMGIATPAFAALYNLLTDFIPLINSMRLYTRGPRDEVVVKA